MFKKRFYELTRHHKPWTPEEDEFLRRNCGKMIIPQMGLYLRRTPEGVRARLKKLGLKQSVASETCKISKEENVRDYLPRYVSDEKFCRNHYDIVCWLFGNSRFNSDPELDKEALFVI